MICKPNSYLMSIFHRGLVNLSTLTFPISILQKELEIYLLFQKSLKNSCKISFFFYPYTFDMSYKSFSYLTPFSRRGPVNLLTPFSAIAIPQRQWQIKSLLGNLIKNYCDNLYFHPRLSKFFFKPNSYLM